MHFYSGFRTIVRLARDVQACNAVRYAKMFAQLTGPVRGPQCTERKSTLRRSCRRRCYCVADGNAITGGEKRSLARGLTDSNVIKIRSRSSNVRRCGAWLPI
jgi:hypothetical protein